MENLAKPRENKGERMKTEVRICGHKLFRRNVWRVRINGQRWLYDKIITDGKHLSVVFRREEVPL